MQILSDTWGGSREVVMKARLKSDMIGPKASLYHPATPTEDLEKPGLHVV